MSFGRGKKPGGRTRVEAVQMRAGTPGKRTRVEAELQRWGDPVQRRAADHTPPVADVDGATAAGIATAEQALPHRGALEAAFGPAHDLGGVRAHVGGDAEQAAHSIGAEAYATGDHVVLPADPSLGVVAHEVTHVLQQRGGVQLSGGIGAEGDPYDFGELGKHAVPIHISITMRKVGAR